MATYHYVARFQLEGKTIELKDSSGRGDLVAAVINRHYKTGKLIIASRHNTSRAAEDTCANRKQLAIASMFLATKTIEILQEYLREAESRLVISLEQERVAEAAGTVTGNASYVQYQQLSIARQKVELARVDKILRYQEAVNK